MSDDKIQPVLFIGGPADGKRMSVKYDYCHIPDLEPLLLSIEDEEHIDTEFNTVTYRREKFIGKNEYFYLMVSDHMSTDEMIAALIDGYKNPDTGGGL